MNSERERIVLLPKHWASSTYPISGARSQESINKQIVLKSDLLICIFGARLGAPTGNEMSGSIEEINEHLKAGKDVMVFFKNSGSYDIDPDQLKKVRNYQNSIKDSVLWVTVKDEDEFRQLLPDKLQLYLNDNWLRHSEEEEIHDDEILRGADRAISSAHNSISFNGFVEALNTLFDALKELQQCYNKIRAKKTIEIVLEFIHEILNARTKIGKCRVSKTKLDKSIMIGWPYTVENPMQSTLDYIESIQNPSGTSLHFENPYASMQESIEELLKATETAKSLQNTLSHKFKMPKVGEWPLSMKGYPWGATPKDKKQ